MQPHLDRAHVARLDPIGALVHDLEAHVFQHGHAFRQRDRLFAAPDFQARARVVPLAPRVEVRAERANGRERFDQPDVGDRDRRHIGLAIRDRERIAIAADELLRLDRLVHQRERLGEPVGPGAHQRLDRLLQRRPLRIGRLALVARDDEMHAHQRAFGEERIERRDASLVGTRQIAADLLARRRVVALARHEHHDGHEPVEAVAPRQHAHARALVEMHDGEHELVERVLVDLEQLVARIVLQHGGERLARMAVGIEARAAHQVVDLAPQIRDRAGRARVGRGGEQADDAEFADQPAVIVEALHADVVHVHATVHARTHVRLGDNERLRLLQEFHDLGRDRDQFVAAAQYPHLGGAQDAESGLEDRLVILVLVVASQRVFAHAEEGEIVGDQPFEELGRLGDFLDGQRRRIVLDLGDHLADARHHRPPVLHA